MVRKPSELTYRDVISNFIDIGLIDPHTMKPVSKTEFKKRAKVHVYEGRTVKIRVAFFGLPRRLLCAFHPTFRDDNQKKLLEDAYNAFRDLVDHEDMERIGNGDVEFGAVGVPVSYGSIAPRE